MKTIGVYPRVHVDTAAVSAVGHAGGVLLTETIRATGLDRVLSGALGSWRKPLATHDPGKVVLDLMSLLFPSMRVWPRMSGSTTSAWPG